MLFGYRDLIRRAGIKHVAVAVATLQYDTFATGDNTFAISLFQHCGRPFCPDKWKCCTTGYSKHTAQLLLKVAPLLFRIQRLHTATLTGNLQKKIRTTGKEKNNGSCISYYGSVLWRSIVSPVYGQDTIRGDVAQSKPANKWSSPYTLITSSLILPNC